VNFCELGPGKLKHECAQFIVDFVVVEIEAEQVRAVARKQLLGAFGGDLVAVQVKVAELRPGCLRDVFGSLVRDLVVAGLELHQVRQPSFAY